MKHHENWDGVHGPGGSGHGRGRGRGRGRRTRWMGEYSLVDVRLVEPALLAFLNEEPQHGYALLERLDALGLGAINPSVIYRILRNYEEIGLVDSDWDEEDSQGPPRRVYAITEEGREAMQRAKESLIATTKRISALVEIMSIETEQESD